MEYIGLIHREQSWEHGVYICVCVFSTASINNSSAQ